MAEGTTRTPRAATERDKTSQRPTTWKPANLLPVPEPQDGYSFRWVRTSTLGKSDNANVSSRFREGFEPVRAADHPEVMVVPDIDTRFPENIEIGGLILCKIPSELMQQRDAHYRRLAEGQMQAVDDNYLRENDPRMPMLKPERQTRTSRFGRE